jgi:glycine cleavage system regulatory protein
MRIEIEAPGGTDDRSLRRDLEALAEELQKTVSLTPRRD